MDYEHYKNLICPFMSGPVPREDRSPVTKEIYCRGPKCMAFRTLYVSKEACGKCQLIPECTPVRTD